MLTTDSEELEIRDVATFDRVLPWAAIQEVVLALASQSREVRPDRGTSAGAAETRITIGGRRYEARARKIAGACSEITVVLLERCARDFPTDEELRGGFGFTASESRVARLLAARRSNREIARDMHVTEHTARRHTEKVLQKLGVRCRTDVERGMSTCRQGA